VRLVDSALALSAAFAALTDARADFSAAVAAEADAVADFCTLSVSAASERMSSSSLAFSSSELLGSAIYSVVSIQIYLPKDFS
jgi:hypothetical protein